MAQPILRENGTFFGAIIWEYDLDTFYQYGIMPKSFSSIKYPFM
jgi:hypothetical protein